jgi:uncharacterized protein
MTTPRLLPLPRPIEGVLSRAKMGRLLTPLLALLALLAAWPSMAQEAPTRLSQRNVAEGLPPRPRVPVHDGANIIAPAAEQQLNQRLTAYNRTTGRAIVVATVPDLAGMTIEMYAVELFETWGIGGAETDEGVLLLVAPSERGLRIETGYGTTATLTDALSGRIIRDTIVPRFRANDYSGGIVAGVNEIIRVLDADPATRAAIEEAEAAAGANRGREGGGAGFIGIIFWIALIGGFMLLFGRGGRGRRRRRYGAAGAVGDILLWSAISSMSGGRGGGGWGGSGGFGGGGGGGFGGFGGGMSGGGGASGSW